ncbi:helix-turn-helix domain-containing protein [Mycobacterium sp. SMC-8]|uniref:helix-turn-helix domain-containing protein n=1 Tax=Mycobacterium sp. SMC-8 TaxID=2857060 RepID=UPI0021B37019|nr:helix-turn-helix domain-containing protein [Mycobacterium sp. SMC-8]UXA12055.1 helix-turn-helix domain-containing protein [Mycobacterium sp. SMC-8]
MAKSAIPRRFVNTVEAAEYFGVHPNTIRNWLAKGAIKAHRSPGGRQYMFELKELETLVSGTNA